MELSFPIEFLVHGTPVSLQAKRAASREEWKGRVKAASSTVIPDHHYASEERVAVTLFYLPSEAMQGDIDNIVKPILDSLCKHIYMDDAQVGPALLLAWATVEATARLLATKHFERPQTPGRLVQVLASEGILTPTEADDLRVLAEKRNNFIHGELQTPITKAEIERIASILGTMINLSKRQ